MGRVVRPATCAGGYGADWGVKYDAEHQLLAPQGDRGPLFQGPEGQVALRAAVLEYGPLWQASGAGPLGQAWDGAGSAGVGCMVGRAVAGAVGAAASWPSEPWVASEVVGSG